MVTSHTLQCSPPAASSVPSCAGPAPVPACSAQTGGMPAASVLLPPELCALLLPSASGWPQQQRPAHTMAPHQQYSAHASLQIQLLTSVNLPGVPAAVQESLCDSGTLPELLCHMLLGQWPTKSYPLRKLSIGFSTARQLLQEPCNHTTSTHLLLPQSDFICLGLALRHTWLFRLIRPTCRQHKCCCLGPPVLRCCCPDLPCNLPSSHSVVVTVAGLLWHACCCCRRRV